MCVRERVCVCVLRGGGGVINYCDKNKFKKKSSIGLCYDENDEVFCV